MNSKTAKLIRRATRATAPLGGFRQEYQNHKRLWNRVPRSLRGKEREQLKEVLA